MPSIFGNSQLPQGGLAVKTSMATRPAGFRRYASTAAKCAGSLGAGEEGREGGGDGRGVGVRRSSRRTSGPQPTKPWGSLHTVKRGNVTVSATLDRILFAIREMTFGKPPPRQSCITLQPYAKLRSNATPHLRDNKTASAKTRKAQFCPIVSVYSPTPLIRTGARHPARPSPVNPPHLESHPGPSVAHSLDAFAVAFYSGSGLWHAFKHQEFVGWPFIGNGFYGTNDSPSNPPSGRTTGRFQGFGGFSGFCGVMGLSVRVRPETRCMRRPAGMWEEGREGVRGGGGRLPAWFPTGRPTAPPPRGLGVQTSSANPWPSMASQQRGTLSAFSGA